MAVLKPRTRLIYFRVSEEEFQRFSALCERSQIRSISDLARHAMERLMADPQMTGQQAIPLESLAGLMSRVSDQLDQLLRTNTPQQEQTLMEDPPCTKSAT